MKHRLIIIVSALVAVILQANAAKGHFVVKTVAKNAVRIKYVENAPADSLPDWIYVKHDEVKSRDIKATINKKNGCLEVKDRSGRVVFRATRHELKAATLNGAPTYEATLTFQSPKDEYLFGLGQFQDGYSNVRGLSRRLTQVNTQISIPMLISSKGYGVLWNNYGLVDFNPCSQSVSLSMLQPFASSETPSVTTQTAAVVPKSDFSKAAFAHTFSSRITISAHAS